MKSKMRSFARFFVLAIWIALLGACTSQQPSTPFDSRVLKNAQRVVEEYADNTLGNYHGHWTGERNVFMPNPGKFMPLHDHLTFPDGPLEAIYFEIFVNKAGAANEAIRLYTDEENWKFTVTKDSTIEASLNGSILDHRRKGNLISVTIERIGPEQTRVCLEGQCLTVESAVLAKGVTLDTQAKHLAISNAQYIDRDGFHHALHVATSRYEKTPHPRGVLAWERFSSRLYNDVFRLLVADRICRNSQEFSEHAYCKVENKKVPDLARRLLLQISSWPTWRAHDARVPLDKLASEKSFKAWDRNSWANGYLPAASAFLYLLAEPVLSESDARAAREGYEKRGREFLRSPIFTSKADHWIHRSTNHGAIIIGNAYAGELIYGNCDETKLARTFRDNFRRIAEHSFDNGAYSEGNSYLQVFVLGSMGAAAARKECLGESMEDFFEQFYGPGTLESIARYAEVATLTNGDLMLSYGDCCSRQQWMDQMLALLAPYSRDLKRILDDGNVAHGSVALRAYIERYSRQQQPSHMADQTCFHSELGIGMSSRQIEGRNVKAGLLSTRAHLTHNTDWDLGQLVVAVDDKVIIGERLDDISRRTKSTLRHSAAWTETFAASTPACFNDAGKCRADRHIHGDISFREPTNRSCTMTARLLGDGHRTFSESEEADYAITLVDTVEPGSTTESVTANYEILGEIESKGPRTISLVAPGDTHVTLEWAGYEFLATEIVSAGVTRVQLKAPAPTAADKTTEVGRTHIALSFQ